MLRGIVGDPLDAELELPRNDRRGAGGGVDGEDEPEPSATGSSTFQR
jgi:hypothetical protein